MGDLSFDISLSHPGFELKMTGAIPLDGVTAIMGPSGSGKTSLLMMLAGLERRARGDIRFGDERWSRGRRAVSPEARRVGLVFQEGRLFPHLTVRENVGYGARRRQVSASAVEGVIEGLELGGLLDRMPVTLSGGEARRVALARALASGPEILFLDEPLSGLDEDAKVHVLPYIARAVSGSGIPALYVTHSREEVSLLADRVLHVDGGRISGWGRPPSFLAVTVIERRAGHVTVELGASRFDIHGQGQPGDARRIAIPERGLLISRDPPGPSGALVTLACEVVSVAPRPSGPDLGLAVAGQQLSWRLEPGSGLAARLPAPGEKLWLSLLSAHLV